MRETKANKIDKKSVCVVQEERAEEKKRCNRNKRSLSWLCEQFKIVFDQENRLSNRASVLDFAFLSQYTLNHNIERNDNEQKTKDHH